MKQKKKINKNYIFTHYFFENILDKIQNRTL